LNEQASLNTLLTQYQKLCEYCDKVFAATYEAFRPYIRCSKGCAACCTLETVTPLEAYMIASYLTSLPPQTLSVLSNTGHHAPDWCIFLDQNECLIYPVRPIICRTHGLPMTYPDQPGIDICPLNTELDVASIDQRFLLDAEAITMNLMRLNLAFCMLTQQTETAGERVPLHWLIMGQYICLDRAT
jgi:hypothetical protein